MKNMLLYLHAIDLKYLYMSRNQRHIKSHNNIIRNEEPYATIEWPTDATFISKETMETNEEEKSVRKTSEIIYAQSKLAENTKAKGQTKTSGAFKIMESKTIGYVA